MTMKAVTDQELDGICKSDPEYIRLNALSAEDYEKELREGVEASLADSRPSIPHDEAMAGVSAIIEKARTERAGK